MLYSDKDPYYIGRGQGIDWKGINTSGYRERNYNHELFPNATPYSTTMTRNPVRQLLHN
jgi:hypothetical protein